MMSEEELNKICKKIFKKNKCGYSRLNVADVKKLYEHVMSS